MNCINEEIQEECRHKVIRKWLKLINSSKKPCKNHKLIFPFVPVVELHELVVTLGLTAIFTVQVISNLFRVSWDLMNLPKGPELPTGESKSGTYKAIDKNHI